MVDYSDRQSVRKFNTAYDKCLKYVIMIDKLYPEMIGVFCEKVMTSDWRTIALCAPMILQLETPTHEQKCLAVSSIKSLLDNPDVDGLVKCGFSMNFKLHMYDQYTCQFSEENHSI